MKKSPHTEERSYEDIPHGAMRVVQSGSAASEGCGRRAMKKSAETAGRGPEPDLRSPESAIGKNGRRLSRKGGTWQPPRPSRAAKRAPIACSGSTRPTSMVMRLRCKLLRQPAVPGVFCQRLQRVAGGLCDRRAADRTGTPMPDLHDPRLLSIIESLTRIEPNRNWHTEARLSFSGALNAARYTECYCVHGDGFQHTRGYRHPGYAIGAKRHSRPIVADKQERHGE